MRMNEKRKQSPEEIDGRPEEEVIYWKTVDAVREELGHLVGDLLQKKYLFDGCKLSAEVAERPNETEEYMEHSPTGRKRLVIDWIDLKSQAAYEKWKAESEHVPVIIEEPSEEAP